MFKNVACFRKGDYCIQIVVLLLSLAHVFIIVYVCMTGGNQKGKYIMTELNQLRTKLPQQTDRCISNNLEKV